MSERTPKEFMHMIKSMPIEKLYELLEDDSAAFSYAIMCSLVCAEILKRQRRKDDHIHS